MGRTHSKPNSQAQTVGRVTRDTLKIHRLLHKPFDENPCFRPFFTETGAFHAGFRYYSQSNGGAIASLTIGGTEGQQVLVISNEEMAVSGNSVVNGNGVLGFYNNGVLQ